MATELKVIECPKCGSTQQTEIRPNFFRCGNCGTEYFLDNDRAGLDYAPRPPAMPAPPRQRPAWGWLVAGIALLLAWGGQRLLRPRPAPAGYTVAESSPAADDDQPGAYRWGSPEACLYQVAGQAPGLFVAGTHSYPGFGHDSSYAAFLDATTGAVRRSVALPYPASSPAPDVDVRQFANGDLYLVVNKTAVYRADPAAQTVTDVTKTLFQGQPELTSGVATVQAGDADYGDSFNVFTNDGRNLTYYPLIHQVYTKDGLWVAQHGLKTLRPGSTERTGFTFSQASTTYPDEKIQLLRYQYRANAGGPQDQPRFEWDDDYGGSGIFTSADPHVKRLITPYQLAQGRVLSYSDFTPGRLYFSPRLLYSDADHVLLTFHPTAAPNSPAAVQCLDARTAAIVFTLPLPEADGLRQGRRYPAGFVVSDGSRHAYTISLAGKLLHHLELP